MHNRLVQHCDSIFKEGDFVAMRVKDVFVVGEVARWPEGNTRDPEVAALSRRYLVQVAGDEPLERRHFELGKLTCPSPRVDPVPTVSSPSRMETLALSRMRNHLRLIAPRTGL